MYGGISDQIVELREALAQVERERDEYQAQVHLLTERVGNMTNAATGAAATAESALRRLIAAQVVLDAAYELIEFVEEYYPAWLAAKPSIGENVARRLRELVDAVKLHQRGKPS